MINFRASNTVFNNRPTQHREREAGMSLGPPRRIPLRKTAWRRCEQLPYNPMNNLVEQFSKWSCRKWIAKFSPHVEPWIIMMVKIMIISGEYFAAACICRAFNMIFNEIAITEIWKIINHVNDMEVSKTYGPDENYDAHDNMKSSGMLPTIRSHIQKCIGISVRRQTIISSNLVILIMINIPGGSIRVYETKSFQNTIEYGYAEFDNHTSWPNHEFVKFCMGLL